MYDFDYGRSVGFLYGSLHKLGKFFFYQEYNKQHPKLWKLYKTVQFLWKLYKTVRLNQRKPSPDNKLWHSGLHHSSKWNNNTGQIQEYIEKIDRKAHQIKQLSDNIFEYALITEETEVELGNPEPLESVFYDLLSEAAFYLTEHGYTPDIWLEKGGGNIRVNMEYINRILDNLVSNIIKYADHSSPVVIRSVYGDKEGGLSFENQKNENSSLSKKKEESTNIGIHNICKMMKKMHGYCKVEQNTHTFKILLQFPYT